MNSCTKKNEEVLAEVLDLFLLPDYNVVSTTYLDHLLGHIAENTKDCKKNIYIDVISCCTCVYLVTSLCRCYSRL